MKHTKELRKKPASTREKIAMIEERIIQLQTDINGLQQNLISEMMLLRDLQMQSAKEAMQIALTPRLRKMLERSTDSSKK